MSKQRNVSRRVFMGAVGAAGMMLPFQARTATSKPNILMIIADDLGWGDLGTYGNKDIPTPNIDRLARQGVRFTNSYVTGAVCSPSRAGMMTGRYQAHFGHDLNPSGRGGPEVSVPQTEVTIAERMRAAGYKTGLIGKWHLGSNPEYDPLARGFDEYYGFLGGATGAYIANPKPGDMILAGGPGEADDDAPARPQTTAPDTRQGSEPRLRSLRLVRDRTPLKEEGYLTDLLTREALAFVDRHKANPFFLMVTQHAPHTPLEATKKYLDRVSHIEDQRLRVYAAMIIALDDSVGALLAKLDEHGLTDNTFVSFISDNGCASGSAGTCSNGPVAGFKREFLEGGIRVPMIFRYPGHLKAGADCTDAVISLDMTATVLTLGGADLKSGPAPEGMDLMPFLTGQTERPPHNRFFWRAGVNYAVHEGDWKLFVVQKSEGGFASFLYNLRQDPNETRSLAYHRPDMVKRLKEAYEEWNRSNIPPAYAGRSSEIEIHGTKVRLSF